MSDLADIDDPRVTAFRALIARSDRQLGRNDRVGSHYENGAIAGDFRDLIAESGIGSILNEIWQAETRDSGDDDASPHDAASIAAMKSATVIDEMRGVARLLQWLLPPILPAVTVPVVLMEFLAPHVGKPSGTANQKERDQAIMTEASRRWLLLMAHYYAGRDGGSWVDHLIDIAALGRDKARAWSSTASSEDKDAAREAGRMRKQAGPGASIAEPYSSLERNILRREVGSVRGLHARFRKGNYAAD